MIDRSGLVRSTARLVWLASLLTWGFGIAVFAMLTASIALGGRFTVMMLGTAAAAADLAGQTAGMRWLLAVGVVMAVAIYVLLRALRCIIATVSAGDPFIARNAQRLRTIGWSLLVLQLLDLPVAIIERAFPVLGSASADAGVSPAGWLAVLLAFVLARVFVAGARMRDDLEGTV